jgi:hypothetical protein
MAPQGAWLNYLQNMWILQVGILSNGRLHMKIMKELGQRQTEMTVWQISLGKGILAQDYLWSFTVQYFYRISDLKFTKKTDKIVALWIKDLRWWRFEPVCQLSFILIYFKKKIFRVVMYNCKTYKTGISTDFLTEPNIFFVCLQWGVAQFVRPMGNIDQYRNKKFWVWIRLLLLFIWTGKIKTVQYLSYCKWISGREYIPSWVKKKRGQKNFSTL